MGLKTYPGSPCVRSSAEMAPISLMVVFVDGTQAETALAALRSHPRGANAAIIGRVQPEPPGIVLLKTDFGGTRIVDVLVGDPLPRIC